MRYRVSHKTVYAYENPVSVSHHVAHLTPRAVSTQRLLEHQLSTDPPATFSSSHLDYFGNPVACFTVEGPHRQFSVIAQSVLELAPAKQLELFGTPSWEIVRDLCRGNQLNQAREACEFAFPSPLVPRLPDIGAYAAPFFPPGRPVLEAALDLMQGIHRDFTFDANSTSVATPLQQVFRQRRGVCQDFAHLQIACLRTLGLPARYVSGYLETLPPPGQPRLVGADASHAWLQLWCGEAGWLDLDPTNNLLPSQRHITIAWGRDYADISPIRGVLVGSGHHQLKVAVDVMPIQTE